jgi:hypothetical protein
MSQPVRVRFTSPTGPLHGGVKLIILQKKNNGVFYLQLKIQIKIDLLMVEEYIMESLNW